MKAIWVGIVEKLAPPKFTDDREKSDAANLLNVLILIRLGNTIFFTIVNLLVAPERGMINIANITLIFFLFFIRHIMNLGRVRLATHLLLINLFVGTNITVYIVGFGLELPTFSLLLVLIILASGLLLGPKTLVVYTILGIVSMLSSLLLKVGGFIPDPQPLTMLEMVIPTILLFIEISVMLLIAIRGIENSISKAKNELQERKKVEVEIRKLNEALEQRVVERTAEIQAINKDLEAFTYSISHDLRAPLRSIDGFVNIIEDEYSEKMPEGEAKYLERIHKNIVKMQEMITGLLMFSRSTRMPINTKTINPRIIVNQVIETLKSERKDLIVEFRIGDLPACQADETLLTHVYSNLLRNAVKFTSLRSKPVVECGSQTIDNEVVYFVRDNGAGFDMEYVGKLFSVFQRLHSQNEFTGTGVGLAIVERIIIRHKGRIWAEGAVNNGATFYFSLGKNSLQSVDNKKSNF